MNLELELWEKLQIHHGSISKILILPNRSALLLSFNDTGHLPVELVTD